MYSVNTRTYISTLSYVFQCTFGTQKNIVGSGIPAAVGEGPGIDDPNVVEFDLPSAPLQ